MSATVDANILVYASNQSDPAYPQAIQLYPLLTPTWERRPIGAPIGKRAELLSGSHCSS